MHSGERLLTAPWPLFWLLHHEAVRSRRLIFRFLIFQLKLFWSMGLRSNPVAVSLQISSVLGKIPTCSRFVLFTFTQSCDSFSAMVNLGESSASQLTCNVTRNRDDSVSYTLEPAPNASSYSWSNSSVSPARHTDPVPRRPLRGADCRRPTDHVEKEVLFQDLEPFTQKLVSLQWSRH